MKNLLILSLIAVVLVSGCIDFGGASIAGFGMTETVNNPDISLKGESSAEEVKAGRYTQLQFTVDNKGQTSLYDIKVNAYDQCLFTGESIKEIEEIRPNRTVMWNWKWQALDTDFERDCEIRFLTTYETQAVNSQTITVLSESEYYAREAAGTLNDIVITSTLTDTSLKLTLEFSEEHPFLENEYIYAYINYEDVGEGLLKEINEGGVVIKVPDILKEGECAGYVQDGDNFVLDTDLRFVNRKAASTTCKFKTFAEQPINSGDFRITANYKYQFYNSLLLRITPR